MWIIQLQGCKIKYSDSKKKKKKIRLLLKYYSSAVLYALTVIHDVFTSKFLMT